MNYRAFKTVGKLSSVCLSYGDQVETDIYLDNNAGPITFCNGLLLKQIPKSSATQSINATQSSFHLSGKKSIQQKLYRVSPGSSTKAFPLKWRPIIGTMYEFFFIQSHFDNSHEILYKAILPYNYVVLYQLKIFTFINQIHFSFYSNILFDQLNIFHNKIFYLCYTVIVMLKTSVLPILNWKGWGWECVTLLNLLHKGTNCAHWHSRCNI